MLCASEKSRSAVPDEQISVEILAERLNKKITLRHFVTQLPILGPIVLMTYRLGVALKYFTDPMRELIIWLLRSKETTNFTYDLDGTNRLYLAAYIANITEKSYQEILHYIEEIENDKKLKDHVRETIGMSKKNFTADLDVKYGRRIGWYAFVRILKPKVTIETGVDKGLGACVINAALMRNNEEGYRGYYYGTDINRTAGYMLRGEYANFGEILYGDSIKSLQEIEGEIDLFINDSDHSADYEAREYRTILSKLSEKAIIIGDNCHETDKLLTQLSKQGGNFCSSKKSLEGIGIGAQESVSLFKEETNGDKFPVDNIAPIFEKQTLSSLN